ncbi:hypothetical protein BpHYR1_050192 [Brachionus plicatilis]|uniref:Uncharacterized protein n=1 Tax=Brachionus plicatilis TaxID=10195 RepID=A0A3M7QKR6_BRAPC|nr:hypothetical protein BpHYR1_050192 [Brachionus plicatilis]
MISSQFGEHFYLKTFDEQIEKIVLLNYNIHKKFKFSTYVAGYNDMLHSHKKFNNGTFSKYKDIVVEDKFVNNELKITTYLNISYY